MAQRVNTRFLIVLTLVVAVFAALLAGSWFLLHRHPTNFVAAGDAAAAAGKWDDAATDYGRALSLGGGGNPDLFMKLGEALEHRVAAKPANLTSAETAYENAIAVDPRNIAPVRHLFDIYVELIEVQPNARVFNKLAEVSGKLIALDPSDTRAAAYQKVAAILQNDAGVGVPDYSVNQVLEDLGQMIRKGQPDPDLPMYYVRGKLHLAASAARTGDTDTAVAAAKDARSLLDAVVSARPGDAALNWRAAMLYSMLPSYDPANATADQQKSDDALAKAVALAKPQDARYPDIQVTAAIAALKNGHQDDAERILRNLRTAFPDNPVAELQLGGFLGRIPAKRAEAISVLSKPITGDNELGVAALRTHDYEANRVFHLTRLRIDTYLTLSDPTQKQQLLAQIDDSYNALAAMATEDSLALLQLKAEIQQLKGSPVAAMATYSRALEVMAHTGADDTDLMFHAAMLDLAEGQNGDAEKLLTKLVLANPDNVAARLALADLYENQNSPDKAKPQVDAAEQLAPDAPQVVLARVKQLAAMNQIDAAKPYYARLLETDYASRMAKARAAISLGDTADATRLLEGLRTENPADVMVVGLLVQQYVRLDQKDRASTIVDQALVKIPGDMRLLVLRNQLENASPNHQDAVDPQILAAADPFTRELLGFETESVHGNYDAAAAHLAAADVLKPDNKRVHDLYFQLDLARHRYDLAAREIPTLARLDADDAGGLVYQEHLAVVQGDLAGELKVAQDLVAHRPEFSQSHSLLGAALAANGQPEKAIAEFNDALDRKRDNFDALQGLIKAYIQLNQLDQASKMIATARAQFPNSVTFRELAFNFELNHSDHPENVVSERAGLLQANPDDVANYVGLATAALQVGQIQMQTNPDASRQYAQQARDVLQKAFARWPHDVPVVGLLAQIVQYQGDSIGAEKLLTDLAAAPELADKPQPSQLLYDFYLHTGRPEKALAALRAAFEKSGRSVDLELQLATALGQAGKYDDALALMAQTSADDPRIVREKLQTLMAAGRGDEAEKQIKAALVTTPGSVDLLNMLTSVYLASSRFPDARATARSAIQADPKNADALYHQGVAELELGDGDMDLALRDATELRNQNPSNPSADNLLADIYYRRNQPDDAIRTLEDGLKAAPLDRQSRLRLLEAYSSASPPRWTLFDSVVQEAEKHPQLHSDPIWLVKDAYGQSARGQFDAAVAKIDQAMQLAPADLSLASEKLSIQMNAKDYPAVIATADQLLAGTKPQWWMYMARGTAKAQSDKASALPDFDAALAAAPDFNSSVRVIDIITKSEGVDQSLARALPRDSDPAWRLMAAQLYMTKGDFSHAAAETEPLHNLAGLPKAQKIEALGTLAESDRMLHLPEAARDTYIELLAIAPNDTGMLNNLANVLADDLHEPTEAVTYSQRAYDLSRESGSYVASVSDTHGWVLTLCGGRNAQLGLSILQKVVEEHQDFVDARYHLGEAYLRAAMPADAVKQLQVALDQLQQATPSNGTGDPELKSAIVTALAKAHQVLDGKADIGGKE